MSETTTVARDPFARGEYRRFCQSDGKCSWCGQERRRVYSYVWWSDDKPAPREGEGEGWFCNLGCFRAFAS